MPDDEVAALLAFAYSLDSIKNVLSCDSYIKNAKPYEILHKTLHPVLNT